MSNPWDRRFSEAAYFYGTEPNDFVRQQVERISGPVLSLGEGEGRNAVFLASRGLDVLGVDGSRTGLDKAERLARQRGISIRTWVTDLAYYRPERGHYATVLSVFTHLPSVLRLDLAPRVEAALKPGGLLVMEAYAERQLERDTGGPKDLDMLMTVDKLWAEFPGLKPLLLQEIEREVIEGKGHTGPAWVVQFIGQKPA